MAHANADLEHQKTVGHLRDNYKQSRRIRAVLERKLHANISERKIWGYEVDAFSDCASNLSKVEESPNNNFFIGNIFIDKCTAVFLLMLSIKVNV